MQHAQAKQEDLVFNKDDNKVDTSVQPIKYAITGRPMFASVTVFLDNPDAKVKADSGAMMYCDAGVDVNTNYDGCCDACIRHCCAGEGACFNHYTGPGFVTFGFDEPGDMLAFAVTPGNPWLIAAGAFIAGSENISVSSSCGSCAGYCLGEDLWMTKISCDEGLGMFFAGGYGQIIRQEVPEGQSLLVNNSLFFAAHQETAQSSELAVLGGCWTCCWGGEGFVMKFRGPCVVYTQSRDPTIMNKLVMAKMNRKQQRNGKKSGGAGAAPANH